PERHAAVALWAAEVAVAEELERVEPVEAAAVLLHVAVGDGGAVDDPEVQPGAAQRRGAVGPDAPQRRDGAQAPADYLLGEVGGPARRRGQGRLPGARRHGRVGAGAQVLAGRHVTDAVDRVGPGQ